MDELRVVVSGSGKMGRQVAAAVLAEPGMTPVAYIDALQPVPSVDGLLVYTDPARCFDDTKADVVVDFTNADWTPRLAAAALPRHVRMVVGTTGLPGQFLAELDKTAGDAKTGVIVAPNFAIGAVLMMQFARQAARFFDFAEIIELHHEGKVDAPSGTAKSTAEGMLAARGRPFEHRDAEKETVTGARGAALGGVALHSVRMPGFVAHQEVILGGLGQTLSIRHDSTGRDSFMPGVLVAIREVQRIDGLVVGLDRLLGLG